jgi:hypothetical protein
MKRFYSLLLIVVILVCAGVSNAQTVGSSSNISGTNYWPVLVSAGVYQTNPVYQAGAYKTVTLGNITSTNETVTGYYVVNPTNGLVPAPGLPGYFIIGSFTNSFVAGTNGGSWSTTFNGGATVQCPVQLGLALSAGNGIWFALTNTAYVP